MPTGKQFLTVAAKHVGEGYVLGALAPKNNSNWKGPWDCAEFVSWVTYRLPASCLGAETTTRTRPAPMRTQDIGSRRKEFVAPDQRD